MRNINQLKLNGNNGYVMTEETARNLFWGFYSRLPQSQKDNSCDIKKKSCKDKLFKEWLSNNRIILVTKIEQYCKDFRLGATE